MRYSKRSFVNQKCQVHTGRVVGCEMFFKNHGSCGAGWHEVRQSNWNNTSHSAALNGIRPPFFPSLGERLICDHYDQPFIRRTGNVTEVVSMWLWWCGDFLLIHPCTELWYFLWILLHISFPSVLLLCFCFFCALFAIFFSCKQCLWRCHIGLFSSFMDEP